MSIWKTAKATSLCEFLINVKVKANLPVTIVLVPEMRTPRLGLLHHQLGVVVVQFKTTQQLLKGSNNLRNVIFTQGP